MCRENLGNKNVYILNFGKVSITNQTKLAKVLRSVCGPRRLSERDFPGPRNSGSGDSGYGFVDLGGHF